MSEEIGVGLEVLEVPSNQVTVNGKTFTITPVRVANIRAFAHQVRIITDAGSADGSALMDRVLNGDLIALTELADSDVFDEVVKAVAIAGNIPAEELAQSDWTELAQAVEAVIRINKDFFLRTLMPMLARASAAASRANGTGQTPSSASATTITH